MLFSRARISTPITLAALTTAAAAAAFTPLAAPGATAAAAAAAASGTTLYAAPAAAGKATCADPADACTLSTAIGNAANGDTVVLASGTYSPAGSLAISHSIDLVAATPGGPQVGGSNSGAVFTTGQGTSVGFTGIDLTGGTTENLLVGSGSTVDFENGSVNGASLYGIENTAGTLHVSDTTFHLNHNGAIVDDAASTVTTLTRSTVTGPNGPLVNIAGSFTIADTTVSGINGTAIDNSGTLTVRDSTVTGNHVGLGNSGTLRVVRSTIVDNTQKGIDSTAGTVTTGADIVAGNGADCTAAVTTDLGFDIDSDGSCHFTAATSKPDSSTVAGSLGNLSDNGGPTQTIPLIANSPAIDLVTGPLSDQTKVCGTADQRGAPRPTGTCDAGAFDSKAPAPKVAITLATLPASPIATDRTSRIVASVKGNWSAPTGALVIRLDNSSVSSACSQAPLTAGSGSASTATCSIKGLSVGRHSLTASYGGDNTYNPTLSGTFHVRVENRTATAFRKVTTACNKRDVIKVSTKRATGTQRLTGTLTLRAKGRKLASVKEPSDGSVTLRVRLKCGTYKLSATYSGNTNYLRSAATKKITAAPIVCSTGHRPQSRRQGRSAGRC